METLSPTPDKKAIERAAHIIGCFDWWRARKILQEEGLSEECIAVGAVIASFDRHEYHYFRDVYGAREYGSRVIDENKALRLDERRKLLEGCLKRGGSELERRVWTEMLAEASK